MMNPRGHLYVLSAPSGAGKSTLIAKAVRELPNLWHSVSATTRKPRHYETEDVHYLFLDRDTFHEMIKKDEFLEWAQVFGDQYGTPREPVDRRLAAGQDVIMDLDVEGALQVKRRCPEATLIFIMPPSLEDLRARLVGRESEPEDVINIRLCEAEEEMSRSPLYDHVIVNDDFDSAFRELVAVIENHREEDGRKTP